MIVIYTDGACSGNPGPGGFGTILTYRGHEKEISGGYQLTTNNRMELLAVITGLEAVKDPSIEITIVSDSKYVVDAINQGWLKGWIAKNFNKVKNADLWMRFYRASKDKKIQFKWIKGHAGHHYNERCDVLATTAAAKPKASLLIDQGYLNSKSQE
jgi:ribonuclease HI